MSDTTPTTPTDRPAYAALDQEDKPFADAIEGMLKRITDDYKGLAIAGLTLLSAACDQRGLDAIQEAGATTDEDVALLAAYGAGFAFGQKEGERNAVAAIRAAIARYQRTAQPE